MTSIVRDYNAFPRRHMHRLFSRIQYDANGGCWLWDAATTRQGYGVVTTYCCETKSRTQWYVHRALYAMAVGFVGPEHEMDHKCRIPSCVNPAHLEPVTSQVNKHRSPHFGIHKTHCKHGHEYTPENTKWMTANGKYRVRACLICFKVSTRKSYMKHRRKRISDAVEWRRRKRSVAA